jgi:hypothetical protein
MWAIAFLVALSPSVSSGHRRTVKYQVKAHFDANGLLENSCVPFPRLLADSPSFSSWRLHCGLPARPCSQPDPGQDGHFPGGPDMLRKSRLRPVDSDHLKRSSRFATVGLSLAALGGLCLVVATAFVHAYTQRINGLSLVLVHQTAIEHYGVIALVPVSLPLVTVMTLWTVLLLAARDRRRLRNPIRSSH